MAIRCKVCDSDKKEYIEQLILQGNSNISISNMLKDMDIDISHASINRHKEAHMKEHKETIDKVAHEKNNKKYSRNDYTQIASIESIDMLDKALKQPISANKFRMINNFVLKTLVNQLTIVIGLQTKFMLGECKYPHEEIRGLQLINDIVIKFEQLLTILPNPLPVTNENKSLFERANEINNAVINGKINIETGNKLLSALANISKIFETDELEKRIAVLEQSK